MILLFQDRQESFLIGYLSAKIGDEQKEGSLMRYLLMGLDMNSTQRLQSRQTRQ